MSVEERRRLAAVAALPGIAFVVGAVALPRPVPMPATELATELPGDVQSGRPERTSGAKDRAAPAPAVSRTRPAVVSPLDAELGGQLAVLGAELPLGNLAPGQKLGARFFFEVKRPLDRSWQIFLHVDARSGGYRIHGDHFPVRGEYPTTLWQAGEFITDTWVTTVPRDALAGTYDVWLGFYEGDVRMPWSGGRASLHDGNNRVRVGTVTVAR